jgi:orotate phosphoribosyltransferase
MSVDQEAPSDRRGLARDIVRVAHLTGTFRLRSGLVSTEYFDKYQFESDPLLLQRITTHLATLVPPDTEVLAGLELGGIPLATALSLRLKVPVVFVRKERKMYGTEKLAEGSAVAGQRVCVVEDVITTGGQVVHSTEALRHLGALVESVVCVIWRGQPPERSLAQAGLQFRYLFDLADLSQAAP